MQCQERVQLHIHLVSTVRRFTAHHTLFSAMDTNRLDVAEQLLALGAQPAARSSPVVARAGSTPLLANGTVTAKRRAPVESYLIDRNNTPIPDYPFFVGMIPREMLESSESCRDQPSSPTCVHRVRTAQGTWRHGSAQQDGQSERVHDLVSSAGTCDAMRMLVSRRHEHTPRRLAASYPTC
jgi:hypothetical protein